MAAEKPIAAPGCKTKTNSPVANVQYTDCTELESLTKKVLDLFYFLFV